MGHHLRWGRHLLRWAHILTMATQALSTMGGLSRSLVTHRPHRYMDKHRRAASTSRALEWRAAGRPLCATFQPETGQDRLRRRLAHPLCSARKSESNMREMTEEEAGGAGLEARGERRARVREEWRPSGHRRCAARLSSFTCISAPQLAEAEMLLPQGSSPPTAASKIRRRSAGGCRGPVIERGGGC